MKKTILITGASSGIGAVKDHIHFYLIEGAKSLLLSTEKSLAEIAYELRFEYPQYFNKLFKQKIVKRLSSSEA
jgi:AraC-like DNA-binding protein